MSGNWVTLSHVMERVDTGQRLDRWIKAQYPQWTQAMVQKMLRQGDVRINGKKSKSDARLEEHDVLTIRATHAVINNEPPKPAYEKQVFQVTEEEAADLRARILFKDEEILAINKPAGLAVQGGSKQSLHLDGMLEALRLNAEEAPRLVHRLDQDTSGVLLLARTRAAAQELMEQFKGKTVRKVYWALVLGCPERSIGHIELPLAKRAGKDQIERVQVDEEQGQFALTHYRVVARLEERYGQSLSWVEMMPVTGRTHQLRVHMAAIGHPIIGDVKYGGKPVVMRPYAPQLHLHARALKLEDKAKVIQAPLPEHMQRAWEHLGWPLDDQGVGLLELVDMWEEGEQA